MLAADKDRLIASAKQTALQLRHKELDYYIERYSNLATQSSILAGFAFDSLVELEIHDNGHAKWVESVFYTAGSCTTSYLRSGLARQGCLSCSPRVCQQAVSIVLPSATCMARPPRQPPPSSCM